MATRSAPLAASGRASQPTRLRPPVARTDPAPARPDCWLPGRSRACRFGPRLSGPVRLPIRTGSRPGSGPCQLEPLVVPGRSAPLVPVRGSVRRPGLLVPVRGSAGRSALSSRFAGRPGGPPSRPGSRVGRAVRPLVPVRGSSRAGPPSRPGSRVGRAVRPLVPGRGSARAIRPSVPGRWPARAVRPLVPGCGSARRSALSSRAAGPSGRSALSSRAAGPSGRSALSSRAPGPSGRPAPPVQGRGSAVRPSRSGPRVIATPLRAWGGAGVNASRTACGRGRGIGWRTGGWSGTCRPGCAARRSGTGRPGRRPTCRPPGRRPRGARPGRAAA
jgi:hypothetical protein